MTDAPPLPFTHSETLHELALFAGAGGGILGGHLLGWRTVCAVERDRYAAAVLAQRQNDGALYPFPIWDDVCTFDGRPWRGRVDVVSGGFPCQDISVAGGGAGLSGERSGLWREFARIIREVGPRYVFVENSPALAFRGLDAVLGDLAAMGYDAEWGVLGADDVGAPHRRERMWIVGQLADAGRMRQQQPQGSEPDERGRVVDGGQGSDVADAGHLRGGHRAESDESESTPPAGCGQVADAERPRLEGHVDHGQLERLTDRERTSELAPGSPRSDVPDAEERGREANGLAVGASAQEPGAVVGGGNPWRGGDPADADRSTQSFVGRVANGVAHRVDRLRAIGNGQVPLVAAVAWTELHRRLNT